MSQEIAADSPLRIGSHTFSSRLIVGTGKYSSYELMGRALDVAATECITVAVRRERLIDSEGKNLLDFVDTSRYTILPNTAGCFSADDAIRVARLGREILAGPHRVGAVEHPGRRVDQLDSRQSRRETAGDAGGTGERATRGTSSLDPEGNALSLLRR